MLRTVKKKELRILMTWLSHKSSILLPSDFFLYEKTNPVCLVWVYYKHPLQILTIITSKTELFSSPQICFFFSLPYLSEMVPLLFLEYANVLLPQDLGTCLFPLTGALLPQTCTWFTSAHLWQMLACQEVLPRTLSQKQHSFPYYSDPYPKFSS